MTDRGRLRGALELVGAAAVVLSLIYVGLEVRQNTRATQTATSQSIYSQFMDSMLPVLENPDLAELMVRADTAPASLSRADSLRYNLSLNFQINVHEAVYTNLAQGTMAPGMASGWLDGMSYWICRPRAMDYWEANATAYTPDFQVAMDSVVAAAACPE